MHRTRRGKAQPPLRFAKGTRASEAFLRRGCTKFTAATPSHSDPPAQHCPSIPLRASHASPFAKRRGGKPTQGMPEIHRNTPSSARQHNHRPSAAIRVIRGSDTNPPLVTNRAGAQPRRLKSKSRRPLPLLNRRLHIRAQPTLNPSNRTVLRLKVEPIHIQQTN